MSSIGKKLARAIIPAASAWAAGKAFRVSYEQITVRTPPQADDPRRSTADAVSYAVGMGAVRTAATIISLRMLRDKPELPKAPANS